MKKTFITLCVLGTFLTSNAQLDITPISTSGSSIIVSQNNESYYSPTTTTNLTFIASGDSMTASVSLGDITPNTGYNSTTDTLNSLELIIWVQHTGLTVGTTLSRSYTISSNFNSISATDQTVTIAGNGGTNASGEQLGTFYQIIVSDLKMLEGSSDEIIFTNDGSATLAIDAWSFRNKAGTLNVITSTRNDILAAEGVSISNPVQEGILKIHNIPSNFEANILNVSTLHGNILLSKEVTSKDNTIDVSSLDKGIYLLTNYSTGNAKKIVIQ